MDVRISWREESVSAKRLVVIVPGYGCQVRAGTWYEQYLDFCWAEIVRYSHMIDLVILTGGQTQQKTWPGKTEAGEILAHFLRKGEGHLPGQIGVILEEDSLTSRDNMKGAAYKLLPRTKVGVFIAPATHSVLLLGEAKRIRKLSFLFKKQSPGFEVLPLPVSGAGSSSIKQAISFYYEVACWYLRPLGWLWNAYRRYQCARA